MTLKIFSTLTGTKELFEPVTPGKVGMYVCGPTVYKPSHIGHAVGPIIFDTVKRYLVYKGFDVTWVVNITDVDDKLIIEAEKQGCTTEELAERMTANYLSSLSKLNVTRIDEMPKASEYIDAIIEMCQKLIDQDAAYVSDGDVYFDISACKDYGKLSGRKLEEQQSGMRTLASAEKRNPGDFALWKAAKPEEPDEVKFASPWGPGRPGWHIECSVMSGKLLGETFDIHGGGDDLKFPHHENEIAQSETCHGKPFARYWMHNGLTRFNTKKISKSDPEMAKLMESLVLSNLLGKHSGELIRFLVLSTHYRRPIEFSDEEITSKKKGLDAFYRLFERIERALGKDPYAGGVGLDKVQDQATSDGQRDFIKDCMDHRVRFLEAMDDDFNTGAAVGVLFDLTTAINRFIDSEGIEGGGDAGGRTLASASVQTLRQMAAILGLFEKPSTQQAASGGDDALVDQLMEVLIAVRAEARATKQYGLADLLRDRLTEIDIQIEDRKDGTGWRRSN